MGVLGWLVGLVALLAVPVRAAAGGAQGPVRPWCCCRSRSSAALLKGLFGLVAGLLGGLFGLAAGGSASSSACWCCCSCWSLLPLAPLLLLGALVWLALKAFSPALVRPERSSARERRPRAGVTQV